MTHTVERESSTLYRYRRRSRLGGDIPNEALDFQLKFGHVSFRKVFGQVLRHDQTIVTFGYRIQRLSDAPGRAFPSHDPVMSPNLQPVLESERDGKNRVTGSGQQLVAPESKSKSEGDLWEALTPSRGT